MISVPLNYIKRLSPSAECAPVKPNHLEEEPVSVAEVCRKAGVSRTTFNNWRKKYTGLMPSGMKRLRTLEDENGRLKKTAADLSLDKAMLQDVLSKKL